jgi:hypothetical protein
MSPTFAELVASRQEWIEDILKPWCRAASWKELMQAQQDWANIAGQVDPQTTLWAWAWGRFPVLVHDGLPGLDETHRIRVTLQDARIREGFPDNRESRFGKLKLLGETKPGSGQFELSEAISIDDIISVERVDDAGLLPAD